MVHKLGQLYVYGRARACARACVRAWNYMY